ncbi:MAG: sugar phosphate nucleotidyltransferase [candidate division WOR-3 bacterium]|nr:sugar phosphate nucleotidyltransferase [candidate division WOR-3 bacterium]
MNLNILILAGGMGTRMKSSLPKVMHSICGRPMLYHIVETSGMLDPEKIILLIGNGSEMVRDYFEEENISVEYAYQHEQLGTGDALRCAVPSIDRDSEVIILSGDVPLIRKDTLEQLYDRHCDGGNAVTVLTMEPENPFGYGRIIKDRENNVIDIAEEKDADNKQRAIREVNTGIYCMKGSFIIDSIDEIDNNNAQNEYYITDLIRIASKKKLTVDSLITHSNSEVLGVNNRSQMAVVESIMLETRKREMMKNGVTMRLPGTIYIDHDATVGRDVIIESSVTLKGRAVIEDNCRIGAGSYIRDKRIVKGTVIKPGTVID